MIVASGTSNRQTKALAASVLDAVREAGFNKPRVEGEANGEWIIVDCGSAVAHIMQPAIRQYYHLEEIWGDKPVRAKLGATKPVVVRASEEADKPATAKNTSLRRSSAAKTAARTAELAGKRPAAKKTAAKKAPAKKAAAPKAAKTVVVKAPAKKVAAKKAAPAKKAPARKTTSARS